MRRGACPAWEPGRFPGTRRPSPGGAGEFPGRGRLAWEAGFRGECLLKLGRAAALMLRAKEQAIRFMGKIWRRQGYYTIFLGESAFQAGKGHAAKDGCGLVPRCGHLPCNRCKTSPGGIWICADCRRPGRKSLCFPPAHGGISKLAKTQGFFVAKNYVRARGPDRPGRTRARRHSEPIPRGRSKAPGSGKP